ncbi:MAG: hypothetical protein ACPGXK_11190 [Phycisphaerae bacterium]
MNKTTLCKGAVVTAVILATIPVIAGPRGTRGAGGPGNCDGDDCHRGRRGKMAHRILGIDQVLDYLTQENVPATFTAELFPDADIDVNGTIDNEEWTSFAEDKIAEIAEKIGNRAPGVDADEDGEVTVDEVNAFVDDKVAKIKERMVEVKPELDLNEDGVLSDDEMASAKAAKLTKMLERHPEADLNADGELTTEEMIVARLSGTVEKPERHRRRGFGRRGGGFGGKGGKGLGRGEF